MAAACFKVIEERMSTHIDKSGNAIMVDASAKDSTVRNARAEGRILVTDTFVQAIRQNKEDWRQKR